MIHKYIQNEIKPHDYININNINLYLNFWCFSGIFTLNFLVVRQAYIHCVISSGRQTQKGIFFRGQGYYPPLPKTLLVHTFFVHFFLDEKCFFCSLLVVRPLKNFLFMYFLTSLDSWTTRCTSPTPRSSLQWRGSP